MEKLKKLMKDKISKIIEQLSKDIINTLCDIDRKDLDNKIKEARNNNNEDKAKEIIAKRANQSSNDIVAGYVSDLLDYLNNTPEDFDFDSALDVVYEYADAQTHIFNYDLWQFAPIFADWTEESANEHGATHIIKDRGVVGLLAQGECYFWDRFANEVINATEDLKNNQ